MNARTARRVSACLAGLFVQAITASPWPADAAERPYDPLAVPALSAPPPLDLTVHDAGRERDIPLHVYLPPATNGAPVILFSHGLGGSNRNCAYLGEHWSARGYVAVFLQHAGSDTSVWQGKPLLERRAAVLAAASTANLLLRVKDVPAVLDELAAWSRTLGHALYGRLDLSHVGLCGHSFGAVTTQAVSGQRFIRSNASFTDPRIRAAIAFSPSGPRDGVDPAQAFGAVAIPWMLMTGTRDASPVGGQTPQSRRAVFRALPPGGKYELVLNGAEHSAFGDRALPGDRGPRNPNHHRAILALSTAFWDAWLRGDGAAKAWLNGNGPATVLEPADLWQAKP